MFLSFLYKYSIQSRITHHSHVIVFHSHAISRTRRIQTTSHISGLYRKWLVCWESWSPLDIKCCFSKSQMQSMSSRIILLENVDNPPFPWYEGENTLLGRSNKNFGRSSRGQNSDSKKSGGRGRSRRVILAPRLQFAPSGHVEPIFLDRGRTIGTCYWFGALMNRICKEWRIQLYLWRRWCRDGVGWQTFHSYLGLWTRTSYYEQPFQVVSCRRRLSAHKP
jgi:hypothetical protein